MIGWDKQYKLKKNSKMKVSKRWRKYLIILVAIFLVSTNFLNAQSSAWKCAKGVGGFYTDRSYSIAVDSNGNSYITGRFNSYKP